MAILKNKLTTNFSIIPNHLATDTRISLGARVVMAYIMGLPDDWHIYNGDVCKKVGISKETLAKYWSELEAVGWLARYRGQGENGKLTGGMVYEILDGKAENPTESGNQPYTEKTRIRSKSVYGQNPAHTNKEDKTKKKEEQNNNTASGGVVVATPILSDDEIEREIAKKVPNIVLRGVVLAEFLKAKARGNVGNDKAYLQTLCAKANEGTLTDTTASSMPAGKLARIEAANELAAQSWLEEKMRGIRIL